MQYKQQSTPITCQSHPKSIICSVQISKKCPQKSRFACMKCMMENNTMSNFIELNDFLSTDSLILSMQGIFDCNQKICQYLLESHDQYMQRIENCIQEILTKFNELKSNLVEYLKRTNELKLQFEAELINLQNKMQQVTQVNDYHKSKEWVELEECIEQCVQLFYEPQNQEINVTLSSLNPKMSTNLNSQAVKDFRFSLDQTLNKFVDELPFNRFTQTILDNTIFGNKLIDRITLMRKKQMRLLFSGQRDGMNAAAFWKHCENAAPTISICESESGQVFGGYTPCKWTNNNGYQQDASLTSFLFSITKQQIYPLKIMKHAIVGGSKYGPVFGSGNDLWIKQDFQAGSSILGTSYDISQYQVADKTTHLMGGTTPALKNIEVYLIE